MGEGKEDPPTLEGNASANATINAFVTADLTALFIDY
jgi:hypothetical protein